MGDEGTIQREGGGEGFQFTRENLESFPFSPWKKRVWITSGDLKILDWYCMYTHICIYMYIFIYRRAAYMLGRAPEL